MVNWMLSRPAITARRHIIKFLLLNEGKFNCPILNTAQKNFSIIRKNKLLICGNNVIYSESYITLSVLIYLTFVM